MHRRTDHENRTPTYGDEWREGQALDGRCDHGPEPGLVHPDLYDDEQFQEMFHPTEPPPTCIRVEGRFLDIEDAVPVVEAGRTLVPLRFVG